MGLYFYGKYNLVLSSDCIFSLILVVPFLYFTFVVYFDQMTSESPMSTKNVRLDKVNFACPPTPSLISSEKMLIGLQMLLKVFLQPFVTT